MIGARKDISELSQEAPAAVHENTSSVHSIAC